MGSKFPIMHIGTATKGDIFKIAAAIRPPRSSRIGIREIIKTTSSGAIPRSVKKFVRVSAKGLSSDE